MQENKNVKIEDTPEYKALLENYDQLMTELEADRKARDISAPDDWDRDFRRIIDKTLKAEHRKKILRCVAKRGLIAAACLVVLVGTGAVAETAEGDNMLQVFYHKLVTDEGIYDTYGTTDFDMEAVDTDETTYVLQGENLTEVFDCAREIIKTPILYMNELATPYSVEKAKYDGEYHILTIEASSDMGDLYISETLVIQETGEGINVKEESVDKVYNEYLQQDILIYEGEQSNFYIFNLSYDHYIFVFQGFISLEDCKNLAQNVYLN